MSKKYEEIAKIIEKEFGHLGELDDPYEEDNTSDVANIATFILNDKLDEDRFPETIEVIATTKYRTNADGITDTKHYNRAYSMSATKSLKLLLDELRRVYIHN